jgi:hypothetical protein
VLVGKESAFDHVNGKGAILSEIHYYYYYNTTKMEVNPIADLSQVEQPKFAKEQEFPQQQLKFTQQPPEFPRDKEMAYSVLSPAVEILPPPPPQTTNLTALLLSASSK